MKKYKLIKEYPSSLKLGSVVIKDKLAGYNYINHPGNCKLFTNEEIENYPEFWEEVVGKEYEILSFSNEKVVHKYPLYILKEDGFYHFKDHSFGYPPSRSTKEKLLSLNGVKIHSVKRLSDGKVFTVGDNVLYGDYVNSSWKIKQFQIVDNTVRAFGVNDYCNITYERFRHAKVPVFVTEDGVRIYEGDKYWWVRKISYNQAPEYNIASKRSYDKSTYVYFSTKEKAQEWVNKNKPLFTTEDGVDIFEGNWYYTISPIYYKIVYTKAVEDCSEIKWKTFSTEEKAIEWIDENKPKYSKKQIKDAIMYAKRNQNPYPEHIDTSFFCNYLKID